MSKRLRTRCYLISQLDGGDVFKAKRFRTLKEMHRYLSINRAYFKMYKVHKIMTDSSQVLIDDHKGKCCP